MYLWTILLATAFFCCSTICSFTVLNNMTTVIPDLDAFQANVVEGAAKVSFTKFFSTTLKNKTNHIQLTNGMTKTTRTSHHQKGELVTPYRHRWWCWGLGLSRWRTRRGWQYGPQGGTDGVPHPRCHRRTVAFYRVNEVSCIFSIKSCFIMVQFHYWLSSSVDYSYTK